VGPVCRSTNWRRGSTLAGHTYAADRLTGRGMRETISTALHEIDYPKVQDEDRAIGAIGRGFSPALPLH